MIALCWKCRYAGLQNSREAIKARILETKHQQRYKTSMLVLTPSHLAPV